MDRAPVTEVTDTQVRIDTAPEPAPHETLTGWYSRAHGLPWLLVNLVGIAGILLLSAPTRLGVALGWASFLACNVVAMKAIWSPRAQRAVRGAERRWLVHGLGAVLGLAWGAAPFVLVAHVEDMTPVAGVTAVMMLSSLPILAPHSVSFPLSLACYCGPIGWFLGQRYGVVPAAAGLTVAVLPLLVAARLQQQILGALETLFDDALRLPADTGRCVAASGRDYLDRLRSAIGGLRHLLVDHARLARAFDALETAVLRVDGNSRVEDLNAAGAHLLGINPREAYARPLEDVLPVRAPEAASLANVLFVRCMNTATVQRSSGRLRRGDGSERTVEISVSPLTATPGRPGAVVMVRTISAVREAATNPAPGAADDVLTGLPAQAEFEARLAQALAAGAEARAGHGLCAVDLDHFSDFNDTYGTAVGDRMLQAVAETLRNRLRDVDFVARLDGDRFGALLYHCPLAKTEALAEALRESIAALRIDVDGTAFSVHASIGITWIAPGHSGLAAALHALEAAVSDAKRGGSNRVVSVPLNEARDPVRGRGAEQARRLQTALRDDSFEWWRETAIPLQSGARIAGYCALSPRLGDVGRGNDALGPRELARISARLHLYAEFDRRVFDEAINALCEGRPALSEFDTVGVRISVQSINDQRFVEHITHRLQSSQFRNGRRLCFEIAETELARHWENTCVFVATVRQLGCMVALDAFGVGTSSYHLLKKLSVDYLKIHEDIVRGLTHNSVDYELALSITRLAQSLRIKTIATGVDALSIRDALRELGVDLVQGPLVDRARPLVEHSAAG